MKKTAQKTKGYFSLILAGLLLLFCQKGFSQQTTVEANPEPQKLGLFILGLSGTHQFKVYFRQAQSSLRELLLSNGYSEQELASFSEDDLTANNQNKPSVVWGHQEALRRDSLMNYLDSLKNRSVPFEKAFVFIAAHANGRDEEAMMNVPEDDFPYSLLMEKLDQIPVKEMVLIVAASQGEAWVKRMAKPGRVIIIGNGFRQYDFIPMSFLRFFPDMFRKLARKKAAKLGPGQEITVSLTEAFAATQQKIRHWYKENHLHCTELAFMDADGDGKARTFFVNEEKMLQDKDEPATSESESSGNIAASKNSPALAGAKKIVVHKEDFPVDLNSPDAEAGKEIVYILRKGETYEPGTQKGK